MKYLEQVLDDKADWPKAAVVQEDRELSYRDLGDYSGRLAFLLKGNGVSYNDNVIILLEKSLEAVVSIFGVLKSGAAYVPVDYAIPPERLKHIISNCRPKFVITDSDGLDRLSRISRAANVLLVNKYDDSYDCYGFGDGGKSGTNGRLLKRSEEDNAYVIYTSGSTGRPKGVMIRHKSVTAFTETVVNLVGYSQDTRFLNVSPLYFDASIVDLFCTLKAGGTVFLMKKFVWPNELVNALHKHRITDTLMVSSMLKLLVSRFSNIRDYKLDGLRTVWYGAEPCPTEVIRELKRLLPQVRFIHGYGPTETTHSATLYIFDQVPPGAGGFLPIGKPLPTVKAWALNERSQPVQPGETGELYIGGIQVMKGYCGDPEKTGEALVEIAVQRGEKVYKTGDYVTVDEDGNYVFIGRRDDAVKVGGHLVYLSEVERALLAHENIRDAIVLADEDGLFNARLKAFVVCQEDRELPAEELVSYLRRKLPGYMIPQRFFFLSGAEIPRNKSGKIDRRALAALF
ncbi:MAG: amino acid adenylation domain-containing protein [Peptococcaceae bacterium]|nr:amino acid adenylation domain-containing protein [Peptococcaceae bacterium]MDH7524224.1 amino acid adenylation domain-containing protein [Peptococcaceae bacterium]